MTRWSNSPLILLSHISVRSVLERNNRDIGFVVPLLAETYLSVDESIKGMVLSDSHIETGIVDSAPLTDKDIARFNDLIAEFFDTESFAVRLTTVFGTTDAFFVCHNSNPPQN